MKVSRPSDNTIMKWSNLTGCYENLDLYWRPAQGTKDYPSYWKPLVGAQRNTYPREPCTRETLKREREMGINMDGYHDGQQVMALLETDRNWEKYFYDNLPSRQPVNLKEAVKQTDTQKRGEFTLTGLCFDEKTVPGVEKETCFSDYSLNLVRRTLGNFVTITLPREKEMIGTFTAPNGETIICAPMVTIDGLENNLPKYRHVGGQAHKTKRPRSRKTPEWVKQAKENDDWWNRPDLKGSALFFPNRAEAEKLIVELRKFPRKDFLAVENENGSWSIVECDKGLRACFFNAPMTEERLRRYSQTLWERYEVEMQGTLHFGDCPKALSHYIDLWGYRIAAYDYESLLECYAMKWNPNPIDERDATETWYQAIEWVDSMMSGYGGITTPVIVDEYEEVSDNWIYNRLLDAEFSSYEKAVEAMNSVGYYLEGETAEGMIPVNEGGIWKVINKEDLEEGSYHNGDDEILVYPYEGEAQKAVSKLKRVRSRDFTAYESPDHDGWVIVPCDKGMKTCYFQNPITVNEYGFYLQLNEKERDREAILRSVTEIANKGHFYKVKVWDPEENKERWIGWKQAYDRELPVQGYGKVTGREPYPGVELRSKGNIQITMSNKLYEWLTLAAGSIAHYDKEGWMANYWGTQQDPLAGFKNFMLKNESGKRVRDYVHNPIDKEIAIEIEKILGIENKYHPDQFNIQVIENYDKTPCLAIIYSGGKGVSPVLQEDFHGKLHYLCVDNEDEGIRTIKAIASGDHKFEYKAGFLTGWYPWMRYQGWSIKNPYGNEHQLKGEPSFRILSMHVPMSSAET